MSNKKLSDVVQQGLDEIEQEDFLEEESQLPMENQYRELDFEQELSNAEKMASNTINSLYEFYLKKDLIDEETYLKHKIDGRALTLQQLLFLLKSSQESLIRLMQTINSGEMNARMFEVLATLQRSHLDIVESYSMCLVNAEEEAKKIRNDQEINRRLEGKDSDNGDKKKGLISSNERELMRKMEETNAKVGDADAKTLDEVQAEVNTRKSNNKPDLIKEREAQEEKNKISDVDFEEIDEY